ncbi:MAG TPA: amidohydrolase [Planctomycetota bacterium]|nr:amidohydrolase [Planctomycetota bacterium]
MSISREVRASAKDLVSLRRTIHEWPEPGFKEQKTAALIRKKLDDWGVSYRKMCGTGVVATIKGSKPGPTLLFRADMDALPLTEENKVPYASRVPGFMHACGHDGHVAMALVASRLLEKERHSLRGNVKVMFQPAEEGPGGAVPMIDAGILDKPRVDAAFAIHLWNDLPVGKVGCRAGAVFAAQDEFHMTVHGKGGHGAAPHQTIDPVVVAAQIVTACQTIVARKVNPVKTAVLTFGQIHGGTRHNIIPDTVSLSGTVRALEKPVRQLLEEELKRVVHGVASSLGAKVELEFIRGYSATVNDPGMTEVARRAASRAAKTVEQDITMGAEDMSYVLEKVPGCYMAVGSHNKKRGLVYPHHSARFDFDEKALEVGTEVWLQLARQSIA